MKLIHKLFFALLFISFSSASSADVNTDNEINYLLEQISNSQCTFIRNGDEHDAQNARKHIEKKYNYLKSRIETAEAFIEHAASKSSFSGKPYQVKCSERLIKTASWLTSSLNDYRSSKTIIN